ncbi:MAG: hypothetical protein AB1425_04870 [Actinomycetota bacterium]
MPRPEHRDEERRGVTPRTRRAFGCVTWTYMGILAFLAAAFLLLLPFRYVGSGELYRLLGALSFLGMVLILPGTALAAALGYRTYRNERRTATRLGAGVGAVVGYACFASLSWLQGAVPPPPEGGADPGFVAFWLSQGPIFFLFPPVILAAAALVLYALFATGRNSESRRRIALFGTALAFVGGAAIIATTFEILSLFGAVLSALAGAAGGWMAGVGYARAGGDEMLPPRKG